MLNYVLDKFQIPFISFKMAAAIQFWYTKMRQNDIEIALKLLNIYNNKENDIQGNNKP